MIPYRTFICYSHTNKELVQQELIPILSENSLRPIDDTQFRSGHRFPEQIKNYIAHAHIFIPIISKNSRGSRWVNQEIGMAVGMNIPFLPITIDASPGEMIHGVQAVKWEKNKRKMKERLSYKVFYDLITSDQNTPYFECARLHEDRIKMLVDYSSYIPTFFSEFGHVRQKATLSSFHIPNEPDLKNIAWKRNYGSYLPSPYRMEMTFKEREILERHARNKGCSLIINPYVNFERLGNRVKKSRLKILREFILSMPSHKITIAIDDGKKVDDIHNTTIVGDWFAAESISGRIGEGWKHTVFTRHAKTVSDRIKSFDAELMSIINKRKNTNPKESKDVAISKITGLWQILNFCQNWNFS